MRQTFLLAIERQGERLAGFDRAKAVQEGLIAFQGAQLVGVGGGQAPGGFFCSSGNFMQDAVHHISKRKAGPTRAAAAHGNHPPELGARVPHPFQHQLIDRPVHGECVPRRLDELQFRPAVLNGGQLFLVEVGRLEEFPGGGHGNRRHGDADQLGNRQALLRGRVDQRQH